MIKCKTCAATFPRPNRRGHPPTQCADCKGSPQKPSEAPVPVSEAPAHPEPRKAAQGPLKAAKRPYKSGFCNVRHTTEIHRLCSGIGGCACTCHQEAERRKELA